MANIMMALGRYRFSIDSAAYQSLERVTRYNWQSQVRVGQAPQQQFIGPGEDSISISGVIYPHYKGGFAQVDAMRDEAAKGEPLLMVSGLGQVLGKWVITEVADTRTNFAKYGLPKKIGFRLSLKRYPEDK